MRILSIGNFNNYGLSNTCLHRNWALEKIADTIDLVDTTHGGISFYYRLANKLFNMGLSIHLPDKLGVNAQIKDLVSKKSYDIIWIDKGLLINKKTLLFIKKKLPTAKIVNFSPDNMVMRHNQSQNFLEALPHYDVVFTTKFFIVESLKKIGAKRIYLIHKTYENQFHYPRILTKEEIEYFGEEVGFIGAWEKERCISILYLVDHDIKVSVFGDKAWEAYEHYSPNLTIKKGLFSDQYPKALKAFKISLCFLRKMNSDQHTARTMEIPACGGFMLAERTLEHSNLFEEGKEAEFFSSNEELLNKCQYYLSNKEERKKIIAAGLDRCKKSGYSNEETVRKMIAKIVEY